MWTSFGTIVAAGLAACGAIVVSLLARMPSHRHRARLRHDVDILNSLYDPRLKDLMHARVEADIEALAASDEDRTWAMIREFTAVVILITVLGTLGLLIAMRVDDGDSTTWEDVVTYATSACYIGYTLWFVGWRVLRPARKRHRDAHEKNGAGLPMWTRIASACRSRFGRGIAPLNSAAEPSALASPDDTPALPSQPSGATESASASVSVSRGALPLVERMF